MRLLVCAVVILVGVVGPVSVQSAAAVLVQDTNTAALVRLLALLEAELARRGGLGDPTAARAVADRLAPTARSIPAAPGLQAVRTVEVAARTARRRSQLRTWSPVRERPV